ncbi:hypothetical protein JW998_00885 [candidate division KSB1 bacterium]|nr:hypothetical protein [candidate division KSB1 bacterium]
MKFYFKSKRPVRTFIIAVLTVSLTHIVCGIRSPLYWPADGTTIENLSWNIPLSDSSSVLQKDNEVWLLPIPPDTAVETTRTRHISAKDVLRPDLFRGADQVVRHDRGSTMTEYYCFRQDGVYALGYSGRDSTSLHTLYDPPLLILPNKLENVDSTVIHETTVTLYDAAADSFQTQQKMRISLTLKARGWVRFENIKLPAAWVKMRLSQDAVISYGGTDLRLTDAMTMESDVLLVQDRGPILEWGIRSQTTDQPKNGLPVYPSDNFIQITVHQFNQQDVN